MPSCPKVNEVIINANKTITMNKKMTYEAPVTEQMEVRLEKGLLNLSGGEGGANASAMTNDSSTFDSWD